MILQPLKARRSKTKVDENADAISNDYSGMFIWRIEDFSPVPLPKDSYGSFHTEDSYIVLNSKMHEGRIHRGKEELSSESPSPNLSQSLKSVGLRTWTLLTVLSLLHPTTPPP